MLTERCDILEINDIINLLKWKLFQDKFMRKKDVH